MFVRWCGLSGIFFGEQITAISRKEQGRRHWHCNVVKNK
jgi:hypothetical protein